MAYTTAEAQRRLLDSLALAEQEIGAALASLGEAHDQLDEQAAERLEQSMFRPVQRAYALGRRTSVEFAGRIGLPASEPTTQVRGAPSHGAKGFIVEAIEAVERADAALAELQDSMLPVEVGDASLRAGLSSVRELLGKLGPAAREMLRTLGR
jgi:hypothetical protein